MFRPAAPRFEAAGAVPIPGCWPASGRNLLTLLAIICLVLALSPASAVAEEENYRVDDGVGVYLGILPAAIVRGHPKAHAEGSMHGGAPVGTHQFHIVVAIFDTRSGLRIENASVKATVSGFGHTGIKTIDLQPMKIAGTVTYGNFVTLPGTDRYDIGVEIDAPGRQYPVLVSFRYQHTR
ncbi:iron transporter [Rhizobium aegyptiacum]|uniref:iron transporter n=1 Tax=Rhizobium aegyptiacum TaxID=1764550 RepID=UPI000ABD4EFF|nr:iron transporter [Rhizobium aegyptiacum]